MRSLHEVLHGKAWQSNDCHWLPRLFWYFCPIITFVRQIVQDVTHGRRFQLSTTSIFWSLLVCVFVVDFFWLIFCKIIIFPQWHVFRKMAVVLKPINGAKILLKWHAINHNSDCKDPHWQVGIWAIFNYIMTQNEKWLDPKCQQMSKIMKMRPWEERWMRLSQRKKTMLKRK